MCGIIGYVGQRPAGPIVLDGLTRLEYRGYDSSGIALVTAQGELCIRKAQGKLQALHDLLDGQTPLGQIGIGHTRWATHGKPSDVNAHPHTDCANDIVVIHNGIVENYLELKAELLGQGHHFLSQTDTEVIPHLIEENMAQGLSFVTAAQGALRRLQGAHAIVILSRRQPDCLLCARIGNAGGLVIGYGQGEMLVASDLPALLPHTQRVVFLQDHEMAILRADDASYVHFDGTALSKSPQQVSYDPISAAKGGYRHFMLKEIMEQPEAVMDTLRDRVDFDPPGINLDDWPFLPDQAKAIERVVLVGMGTSFHAALVGRFLIEGLARLPAEVDNASEFRYRQAQLNPHTLVVSVGQSGETVDTLAAMEEARRQRALQLTVCNVVGSQATRIADGVIYTRAGLEVGVAASKTFTAQLVALYLLALHLGRVRGVIAEEQLASLIGDLAHLPYQVGQMLAQANLIEALAHRYSRPNNFLYLGRGINYPIALEGALKLKELSYIHAEGYPAGEMKHGPIALIDENLPVVAIAPRDGLYEKMLSNIEQVKARDGMVLALATEGDADIGQIADDVIYLPATSPWLTPILAVLPLQLLAYHIAVRRGRDVDQPRNLAKTVTVE